jgi:ABC-2 type transport system ATP-binding protein
VVELLVISPVIKAQRDRAATVLLNSHLLGEVEITCDRVAFVKDGEVVETHTLDGEAKEQNLVVIRAGKVTAEVVKGLAPWTSSAQYEYGRLAFSLSSNAMLPEVVRYLVSAGADIHEVAPQRLSLEERFLQIVGSDGGM